MQLAKNVSFYGLDAIAANVRKGAKFLRLYGLPDPASTGSLCLEYEKLA
jgi:IS5 family transposase